MITKPKKVDQWELKCIKSSNLKYHSGKIFFPDKPKDNVQLELVQYSIGGLQLYINFFATPVPCLPDNKTRIKLLWDDEIIYMVTAERLEGGQKVLIPHSIAQKIISNLEKNQSFELSVGIYHTRISSNNFNLSYKKLCALKVTT